MKRLKHVFFSCIVLIAFSFLGCSAANTNETKSTSPTFHQRWIAPNPNATPVPEYVTAWPKQVSVKKLDPVLGDKLVWEHWIYGEEFARRFDGFPIEKADKELKNSPIKAIVLRLFKKNLWESVNPNYPEQYTVDIDLYFEDTIKIPLSEKERPPLKLLEYPKGISQSFKELKPFNSDDALILKEAKPRNYFYKKPINIFVTPIDGRFVVPASTGYYPQIARGLSFVSLRNGQTEGIAVPLQSKGALWLSLQGERPFDANVTSKGVPAVIGLYKKTTIIFEPGEHPEEKGYVKLPHSFYEVALPKMALIEDLNYCISQRYSYKNNTHKQPSKERDEFFQWCEDTKTKGIIFAPSDYLSTHPQYNGLQKTGF